MTEVYSKRLRAIAQEEGKRLGIDLVPGVYACMPGPSYETPAEIKMLRTLGADVVGMSTVPEAIVARHAGIEVLALCPGLQRGRRRRRHADHHEEVLEAGTKAAPTLARLIDASSCPAGGDRFAQPEARRRALSESLARRAGRATGPRRSRPGFRRLHRRRLPRAAAGWVVVRPTAYMPAALAAWMPTGASSKTTDRRGSTPALAAATRKTCGSGLPRVMSSSDAIAANRPSRPHSLHRQFQIRKRAARADRQPHAAGRQGVEHLADPVHQLDLARRHVAIAHLLEVRVAAIARPR